MYIEMENVIHNFFKANSYAWTLIGVYITCQQGFKHNYVQDAQTHTRTHTRTHARMHVRTHTHTHRGYSPEEEKNEYIIILLWPSDLSDLLPAMAKHCHIELSSNIVNVTNAKLCIMGAFTELVSFITFLMTLTFISRSQWQQTIKSCISWLTQSNC